MEVHRSVADMMLVVEGNRLAVVLAEDSYLVLAVVLVVVAPALLPL